MHEAAHGRGLQQPAGEPAAGGEPAGRAGGHPHQGPRLRLPLRHQEPSLRQAVKAALVIVVVCILMEAVSAAL